jgi:hypothetical protein
MGKLIDLIATENRQPGPRCTVAEALASLPKDVAKDLRDALGSTEASTRISRALLKLGHPLGMYPIQRHRRGDCACGRPR